MSDIAYVFEDASGRIYTREEARELVRRCGRGWIARIRALPRDGAEEPADDQRRFPSGKR